MNKTRDFHSLFFFYEYNRERKENKKYGKYYYWTFPYWIWIENTFREIVNRHYAYFFFTFLIIEREELYYEKHLE